MTNDTPKGTGLLHALRNARAALAPGATATQQSVAFNLVSAQIDRIYKESSDRRARQYQERVKRRNKRMLEKAGITDV